MNRPKRDRRKRPRDQTWSGPLASWTDAQTRRQHERNACNGANAFVSIYLSKYILLATVLASIASTGSTPTDSELLRTIASIFLTLTISTAFFITLWWFWPRLAWPCRRVTHAWTGPYPSSSIPWIILLIWTPLLILMVAILCLISPPIALTVSLSIFGMWLILTGIRRRIGCDERCRCGYPVPTPRWSRGPCPECGRDLDRPRAVILGHDTRSPARLTIGLILLLASIALTIIAMR